MTELTTEVIQNYLTLVFEKPVTVHAITKLGESVQDRSVKGFGYGVPLRIDFEIAGQRPESAVLHTMSPGGFGHEHMADRAQILLWSHRAFGRLPRHVRPLDVGGCRSDGTLVSLGKVEELCLLTEFADGVPYARDLARIRETDSLTGLDLARAKALCDYLAEIHQVSLADEGLYRRRIRELVGGNECIMGLSDSYPPHPMISAGVLEDIEHQCVRWRWKLREFEHHRLRQVHGDFHPWNILFAATSQFRLLDRSRGEWGDPADDVSCITSNFLFFSLQRSGRIEGAFATLFREFWKRYLEESGDQEILRVVAPFFAFRGLVMASPVWYPDLTNEVRQKLLTFVQSVLATEVFRPEEVQAYCGA